jgi:hypothetical protein
MPYRGTQFTQGQYYHADHRGAGQANIFFLEDNYRYLVQIIERYYRKYKSMALVSSQIASCQTIIISWSERKLNENYQNLSMLYSTAMYKQ